MISESIRFFVAVFLGIVLSVFLLGFIVSSSISASISEAKIEGVAESVINSTIDESYAFNLNDSDLNNAYTEVSNKCSLGVSKVFIGPSEDGLEIICDQISGLNLSEFKVIVKDKIKEKLSEKINNVEFQKPISLIRTISISLGIVALILAVAIIFLSQIGAAFILGGASVIAGLAFVFIDQFKIAILNAIGTNLLQRIGLEKIPDELVIFIDSVLGTIHSSLIVSLFVGFVFIVLGIILVFLLGKAKFIKAIRKRSEKNKKKKTQT